MTLIKRNSTLDVAPRFFDSFLLKDFLLNDAFENPATRKATGVAPAVNVAVSNDAYTVELLAPGLNKENFSISLEKDELTVSYKEDSKPEEATQKNYVLREFSTRSFSRSFTFPKGAIDEEKILASYTEGILYLELPKREEAKPKGPRHIQVV